MPSGGRRGTSVCVSPCLRSVPACVPTNAVSVPPAAPPLDLTQLDYSSNSPLCLGSMGGKVGPLWTARWATNSLGFLALLRVS